MNKFYITTAIPYVNAKPHIGHALEFIQGDLISRYHKLIGDDVVLLSGSDENALKNVQAAEKERIPVAEFIDKNAKLFENLAKKLTVNFDVFQKGSDPKHHKSSQKLWELCDKSGDIYKKTYQGLYCVGCEQFYEKEELNENGECFEHPGKKLEEVSEENYFFRLSKYQKEIEELLEKNQLEIIPNERKNEIVTFVKQGLKDISISRSNERAKNWGVSVPSDPTQKMYVWFDALNIYRSGVEDKDLWPANLHVIGKGITRFHAVYWPAFLLSAKLPLPKKIFAHGYLTVNGQKMSKTLGNVVDPVRLVEKYGTDAIRYYLLSQISSTEDGDFSEDKLKQIYNANLANGLGNLVARVAKLCERVTLENPPSGEETLKFSKDYQEKFENFKFNEVLENIWNNIKTIDQEINTKEPWKIKDEKELKEVLQKAVNEILNIAYELKPFLPNTSEKIQKQLRSPKISSQPPLFPRINS